MAVTRELESLQNAPVGAHLPLPAPRLKGAFSVEEALQRRRSLRKFAPEPLTLEEISQLLWSAQGTTGQGGRRTAPSAGACYPLEVYLVCAEGLFRYLPGEHALEKTMAEDVRTPLTAKGHTNVPLPAAPIALVFAAVYERTTQRYGERGIRYAHIDLGHAAQNAQLQAEALGLASVALGAFDDDVITQVLHLPADQKPIYVIPFGRKV